jgi:hypothetical protein
MVMSFSVPFLLADQLGLQRDIYYGLYIAAVAALFVGWSHDTEQSLRDMCAKRWRGAAGLGLIVAGLGARTRGCARRGSDPQLRHGSLPATALSAERQLRGVHGRRALSESRQQWSAGGLHGRTRVR